MISVERVQMALVATQLLVTRSQEGRRSERVTFGTLQLQFTLNQYDLLHLYSSSSFKNDYEMGL